MKTSTEGVVGEVALGEAVVDSYNRDSPEGVGEEVEEQAQEVSLKL